MMAALACAMSCALTACGDGAQDGGREQAAADKAQRPETGATAAVSKLDEGQRNGVFEKAIRASGAACPGVSGSERAEIRPGVRGWKAQCDNGSAHLIQILSDGTAEVTSRTH